MVEQGSPLQSSIEYPAGHHFPLENIPFGVFNNIESGESHVCTRIGDQIIDLAVLFAHGLFHGPLFSGLKNNVFN